jgi:hypothetical protein
MLAPSIKYARSPGNFPEKAPIGNRDTGLALRIENSASNALIVPSGNGQYNQNPIAETPKFPFGSGSTTDS